MQRSCPSLIGGQRAGLSCRAQFEITIRDAIAGCDRIRTSRPATCPGGRLRVQRPDVKAAYTGGRCMRFK
jgi:hypothetical protein